MMRKEPIFSDDQIKEGRMGRICIMDIRSA
jgi:hypothetical protein